MADLTEAIRAGLAAYLAGQLAGDFPTLKVLGEWPNPDATLPEYALTVLATGAPDVRYHPAVVRSVVVGSGATGTVRSSYARLTLGLQLDAWARYAATRDALAAAVRDALNRHPADTLGGGGLPRLGRRGGLVLTLPALLDAPCEFRFGVAPSPQEAPEAAQDGEWRASWAGTATTLALDEAQLALIKTLRVTLTTNGATPPDTTTLTG